ncbi:hypothetical protein FRC11_002535 [Ceratobasidium sp. 423]|nr:hypothetical protein FRC11_002535 [Ceratobasidium sp. 423]
MVILILLASINSARIARLMDQSRPSSEAVRDVEAQLWNWNPVMDYANEPPELITRLAIWECWRQSTLIYLYMGMCGVDSADERIRPLVSQIAQLARTVEAGTPLEAHLFVPCLIAGVAARKEKHRAILRRKMLASQKIEARLLRGADFVFVLDHLWHGAAAGGNAVTWEDYVNSRHVAMPIDI